MSTPKLIFHEAWANYLKDPMFAENPELGYRLVIAICDYAYHGELPTDPNIKLAMGTIIHDINLDKASYEQVSKVRSQAAMRRAAKQAKAANVQTETNEAKVTDDANVAEVVEAHPKAEEECLPEDKGEATEETEKPAKKRSKKEVAQKTEEDIQFDSALKDQYPRISRMKDTLTLMQYNTLVEKFGQNIVYTCMGNLENYAKINNYVSSYHTLSNWCKLEIERNGNRQNTSRQSTGTGSIFDKLAADYASGNN